MAVLPMTLFLCVALLLLGCWMILHIVIWMYQCAAYLCCLAALFGCRKMVAAVLSHNALGRKVGLDAQCILNKYVVDAHQLSKQECLRLLSQENALHFQGLATAQILLWVHYTMSFTCR